MTWDSPHEENACLNNINVFIRCGDVIYTFPKIHYIFEQK
jgi:hypothetical protein